MPGMVNGKWMLFLCLLCLFDAAATDAGLQAGYITEGNPLMDWLYQADRFLFYGCKLALPLILWGICHSFSTKGWFRLSMFVCVALYSIVGLLHVGWIYVVLAV